MNWNILRKLILANPMGIFIYALISKWYIMMAIGGLVTAFWVFKGLEKAGVIDEAVGIISKALTDSKSVAKHCVPKIANIKDFWLCLENPPQYVPEDAERLLEETVKKSMQNTIYDGDISPYDSKK